MKRPQVSPGDPAIDPEKEQRLARRHNKRPDMSWRDHLVMLLYFGAEIEHSLMVQYLYAAYSINENQSKPEDRLMMERWRSSILSVAREEMGHLLTVQNLLVLLGAPVNFYRRDFPWTTDWYPFPPRLEKFSEKALACYIYAEMPQHVHPKLKRHSPDARGEAGQDRPRQSSSAALQEDPEDRRGEDRRGGDETTGGGRRRPASRRRALS